MLTPKEHEVLEQRARNFSNKEIALAMQVSEQAIKWHVEILVAHAPLDWLAGVNYLGRRQNHLSPTNWSGFKVL